jgi:DNA-binding transcriptional MerR regulator
MTSAELCAALSIDRNKLARWIKRGLPSSRDRRGQHVFDEDQVGDWLLAQGLAVDPAAQPATAPRTVDGDLAPDVKTLTEVARRLSVSPRQVGYWKAEDPTGPLAGVPPYNMDAIRGWLEARGNRSNQVTSKRREIQEQLDEITLRRKLREDALDSGEALDRAETLRVIERFAVEAVNVFDSLRGDFAAILPESLDADVRADLIGSVERIIERTHASLAEVARRLGQNADGGDA